MSQSFLRIIVCIIALLLSASVFARGKLPPFFAEQASRADRTYTSFAVAMNEFRSVNLILDDSEDGSYVIDFFPLTGQTYSVMGTLGTYITDHFKTELRFGTGVRSDKLKQSLEINMKHWVSWYIGATHPITDYMSAYALYGVSHYAADVTRHEIDYQRVTGSGTSTTRSIPSRTRMEEDLFATSFSTSWMLGFDFNLSKNWFLAFEYGRLLRDTDTNIKVRQANTALRYEF